MSQHMSGTRDQVKSSLSGGASVLQRQCACGRKTIAGARCAQCNADHASSQRTAAASSAREGGYASIPGPHGGLSAAERGFSGENFSKIRVHGDGALFRGFDAALRRGVAARQQASGENRADGASAELDVNIDVIKAPPSRLRAAIASDGADNEAAGEDEDVLTAQTPAGPVVPGGGPTPPSCTYVVSYENVRNAPCNTGLCGAKIIYDITAVKATGLGCPSTLNGLMVTESVSNDHGCSPANVQGGAGCPIAENPPMAPGNGIVRNCTDTYGVCLGSTSQSRIPPAGCTETVTQQIFVGGVLAETHLIRFNISKSGAGCGGTVTRT